MLWVHLHNFYELLQANEIWHTSFRLELNLQESNWNFMSESWNGHILCVWAVSVPNTKIGIKPDSWCICTLWWSFQCTILIFLFGRRKDNMRAVVMSSCSLLLYPWKLKFYCFPSTAFLENQPKLPFFIFSGVNWMYCSSCWLAVCGDILLQSHMPVCVYLHSFWREKVRREKIQHRGVELIRDGNRNCDRRSAKTSKNS